MSEPLIDQWGGKVSKVLWWVGLPLRFVLAVTVVLLITPVTPNRADEVLRDAKKVLMGRGL